MHIGKSEFHFLMLAHVDCSFCCWLQALRSGVINGSDSYSFEVPSNYREVGVANIQSGNFCMVSTFTIFQLLQNALLCICAFSYVLLPVQPNCAEPWTEVVFADDKEGKIQVQRALGCCHLTPYWS